MYNDNSSPTLTDCTFIGNTATKGGGMYNNNSNPTLTDCTFVGNTADFRGGGMFDSSSGPVLTGCKFVANTAPSYGGAMGNSGSSPVVVNCLFAGNSSINRGGAMDNFGSSPTIVNTVFVGNEVTFLGGGMYNGPGSPPSIPSTPELFNCTLSANVAGARGGGVFNDVISGATIRNSVLWGNSALHGTVAAMQIDDEFASLGSTVTFSDIQDDLPGDGDIPFCEPNCGTGDNNNIDLDPVFVGGPTGTWSGGVGASYDPNTGVTTITDAGLVFGVADDALAGQFFNPQSGPAPTFGQALQSLIVANSDTLTEIQVLGDFTSLVVATADYRVTDYHLLLFSPARDSGDNTALPADVTDMDGDGDTDEPIPFDIEGNMRITNLIVDMGCYENFPDCNENGINDLEDIAAQTSLDCNNNNAPDECEIDENSTAPGGPFFCTFNCDPDCNNNGIPDQCDLDSQSSQDCNGNGIADECDIVVGISQDCDGDIVPDECQIDVNSPAPGGPFFCTLDCDPDCNDNAIPDACDPDCDGNTIPDDCDIASGTHQDCNQNGRPDSCDITVGAGALPLLPPGSRGGFGPEVVFDSGTPSLAGGLEATLWTQADDFTLASLTRITSVRFWFIDYNGWWDGACEYAIREDAGGFPGAIIDSGSVTLTQVQTGRFQWGRPEWQNEFMLPAPLDLNAGGYWLTLHLSNDCVTQDWVYWMVTSTYYGWTNRYDYQCLNTWNTSGNRLAFQLGGFQLIVGVNLTPETAENPTLTAHTLTATVRDEELNTQPDVIVDFEVLTGPNAGTTGIDVTDVDGKAYFTYVGTGGEGTDEIQASFFDGQTTQVSNIATKTWILSGSTDCNTNGIPDDCDVDNSDPDGNGVYSCDDNGDVLPDECQVVNLTLNTAYPTIPEAIAAARNGDHLLAAVQRFVEDPSVDFDGKSITLTSRGEIVQPAGGSMMLADDAALAARSVPFMQPECSNNFDLSGALQDLTLEGGLVVGVLDSVDIEADRFITVASGSIEVRAAAGADILADAGAQLAGTTQVDSLALLAFSAAVDNTGGISLFGGTIAADPLTNEAGGGTIDGWGDLFADVINNGDMTLVGDTYIVGDLHNDGTITVQSGRLTILGNLTGSGQIIGDFFGRSGNDGLTVIGDYAIGASGSLTVVDGTLKVGGDIDIAIDDFSRFDMAAGTLQLIGLPSEGPQLLEVLSGDVGREVTLPDMSLFSLGKLRIGPTATSGRLVDGHDNATGEGGEALYVVELVLESGVTLDLAGLRLYYGTVTPADPFDPGSGVTIIDSVGGGTLCRIGLEGTGDFDADCDVDFDDLPVFIAVLLGEDTDPGHRATADMNDDGPADGLDIQGFVDALVGP